MAEPWGSGRCPRSQGIIRFHHWGAHSVSHRRHDEWAGGAQAQVDQRHWQQWTRPLPMSLR